MFTWATFENHWDLILGDCSERREKETQKFATLLTFRKRIFSNKQKISEKNINR